jgi:hypothetical protein
MKPEREELPLRIEMATSEIEGSGAVAWADPDRILGVVAEGEPPGAFERFLLPHLLSPEGLPEEEAPTLPEPARILLAAAKETHRRLYRENRSVLKDPHRIRFLGATVEGRQLHLMGCGGGWAFVIRGGRAHPLSLGEEGAETPLGGERELRLGVLTLDLEPDDQVVLLMGGRGDAPDLRAVANAFGRTQDLKRGCDGLVNLMGLQESAAAAVALRLRRVTVPATPAPGSLAGEEVLKDLMAEATTMAVSVPAPEPADATTESPRDPGPMAPRPEPGRTRDGSISAAPGLRSWRPSFERGRRWSVPLAVWVVVLLLLSLVGLVALSPDGWERVREAWQGWWSASPEERVDPGAGEAGEAVQTGTRGAFLSLDSVRVTALAPGQGVLHVEPPPGETRGEVWVDTGATRYAVPCDITLEGGWHRLYYEGPSVALWSKRVLVPEGGTTHVSVASPPSPGKAYVRVEAFLSPVGGQGWQPAEGDSVFLDRRFVGFTPWEGEVDPGWHSLRVAWKEGPDPTEVFTARPGQRHFFSPRLGLLPEVAFQHVPPGRVLLQDPVLLSVVIRCPETELIRRPQVVLLDSRGGEPREVGLALVDPLRHLFVGAVPARYFQPGVRSRYYFRAETEGGTPLVSEIFELETVSDALELSQR